MKKETITKKKQTEPEYDFTRASSSMECTGLTPSLPKNREEQESYMEIYDYSPEVIKNSKERDVVK